MLLDTPQICWHGGEGGKSSPILSIDAHPLVLPGSEVSGSRYMLATAGTDAEVRLWMVNQPTEEEASSWEQPEVSGRLQSFVASFGGHERGVNVVRFSPDGLSLASASDGGTVVIWSVETLASWSTLVSDRDARKTILRGATEDIYDIAWSPDSTYIACGSIDRRAHVWEVTTKRSIATIEDHANYVQGTAWDPLSRYLATQSSDRSCRVYNVAQDGGLGSCGAGPFAIKCCNVIKACVFAPADGGGEPARTQEGTSVVAERTTAVDLETRAVAALNGTGENSGSLARAKGNTGETKLAAAAATASAGTARCARRNGEDGKQTDGKEDSREFNADSTRDKTKLVQRKNLFVDETVTSFFRRLSWSPDGAFLITPTAQHWDAATKKSQFCTYIFRRGQFVKPAVCLPGLNKPSIAVRCNPVLFSLKGRVASTASESVEAPMCDLPYRAVFAVVSLDAVVVYDTEHAHPLAVATGLHYSGLTDACWSADGLSLFVSSTDGYVSKIHFEQGELGVTIPESEVPPQTRRLHPVIYGRYQEPASVEAAGKKPTPCPLMDAGEKQALRTRDEGDTVATAGEARAAISHTQITKPKKNTVPTLVAPGNGPQVDVERGPTSTAVSPSPSPPSIEKKKRRIAPTLVHSGVDTQDVCLSSSVVEDSSQNTVVSAATALGTAHDRTSKKKRLAPTLVSAL